MQTIHVIIDPQNDFIDDEKNSPTLAVKGALSDMHNLAKVISQTPVDKVLVTLDSHAIWDIAHTSWWRDAEGKEINHFTEIKHQDILDGKFVCANPELTDYSLAYTKSLEEQGNYKHFIWPNHCIVGTVGHKVHDVLSNALDSLKGVQIDYLKKGLNPKTEHYSAFKAEVPVADDATTDLNQTAIDEINKYDRIVFSGEALSHCVRASVLDFLMNIPEADRSKVILLTDCMSSVTGFENNGDEFLVKAKELGANLMNSDEYIALCEKKPSSKKTI